MTRTKQVKWKQKVERVMKQRNLTSENATNQQLW
jgi:hypothetical protein